MPTLSLHELLGSRVICYASEDRREGWGHASTQAGLISAAWLSHGKLLGSAVPMCLHGPAGHVQPGTQPGSKALYQSVAARSHREQGCCAKVYLQGTAYMGG